MYIGFPGGAMVTNLPANAGRAQDAGSIPGLGRSPGRGNGNPLQYSCLGNPMDRGAWWWASPRGHKELDTTEQLTHTHTHTHACTHTRAHTHTLGGTGINNLPANSGKPRCEFNPWVRKIL